ncbi:MAG TPA: hypothetical protein VFJ58_07405 [Armatimonadota bacterium]|nr:hypothetical protein [Armatimonadota bacterium]
MRYSVYSEEISLDYAGRDDAAGILGTIKPITDAIARGDDLETLETKALAYLCKEPEASVYLADAEGHVYKHLINSKYHEAVEAADQRL